MENLTKIVFGLLFMLVFLGGMLGTHYWYKIDVEKCNDIRDNDYYYTENNCWRTENLPSLTKFLMFMSITIFPLLILGLLVILNSDIY